MTRKAIGLCAAAAIGCAVSLGAQSTTTATTSQRSASAGSDHEVTVTGCLSKSSDGDYILTHARSGSPASTTAGTSGAGATTATGTTGTSTTATEPAGSGASASARVTWKLSGAEDLDKHIGHTIEVTGRAESATPTDHSTTSSTSTAGTSGTTTPEPSASSAASSPRPRLDVQSVKLVASTCSQE